MNNHETKNGQTVSSESCPCCPRHCPLDATSCEKGAAYAAMSPEERTAGHEAHSHGGNGERGGHPHGGDDFHRRGEGHGRGHGPHGHKPDGPDHHGPHPEFFDDPDSLNSLMHRCGHALRHRADRERGQRSVLALLAAWGETDQRTLQNALAIQPGSVSELLSKLEAKGYIVKSRSEQDRRMATVTLTEEGKAVVQSLPEKKQDLYAALTSEEQETLKALLKKLLESWE